MHGIILAGGMGKRLRPITDYIPKSLVCIDGTPIIEWQIRHLKRFGIREVTVCAGYRSGQIENFVKAKSGFGISVRVSAEQEPLGTAGAIKNAADHIAGGSFLVMNGDTITDIDLSAMQRRENAVACIRLRTQYGTLEVSGDRILAFREKRSIADVWMNAGIYHLSHGILEDLPSQGDIEKTVFPEMARQGRLHAVRFEDARWFSIDSFKDIEECARAIGSAGPH